MLTHILPFRQVESLSKNKSELKVGFLAEWKIFGDYPFTTGPFVAFYDMLFIPETRSYLVIGGYYNSNRLSQIARFQDGIWSDAGKLKSARYVSFRSFFLFFTT